MNLKWGTSSHPPPEEILQLLTKFDKTVFGTGNPSIIGKIAFLIAFLWGKAPREYYLIVATFEGTTVFKVFIYKQRACKTEYDNETHDVQDQGSQNVTVRGKAAGIK